MPAPVTFTFRKNAKSPTGFVAGAVSVDATSVMHLIDTIEEAVSPPSLALFMTEVVSPYMEEQIVQTFANWGQAGTPGGTWAPLAESTIRIREALGYTDDNPNIRTGELFDWVRESREFGVDALGVSMTIPGPTSNSTLEEKLRTAQLGRAGNHMIPGASTPARPVLALTLADQTEIMRRLQVWIMSRVGGLSMALGST